jgi:outer membrane lipoprotein-sorting protein
VEKIQTNNATDNYVGKITMKGNKYKVEVMDTETYFDGATLWTYLPDANEVSISDVSMLENSLLDPTTIFTIHEKGYKYIYAGETTINNKKVDIIDLFPEKRDQPFSRIKVYVYKDNLQFARLAQIGRDGTNYIIDIKKLEINIPTDDAIFIFDTKRYSGIEVIDMR